MSAQPAHVLITGAAGQIGYTIAFYIAHGEVFGRDRKIVLHLYDLPCMMEKLDGYVMELTDCAFPLLVDVIHTDKIEEAFKDIDYAFFIASVPLKKGGIRADLLKDNAPLYKQLGEALSQYAKPTVKVLVIGNPANTNCLVAMKCAKNLGPDNFSCLCRLDQNRSYAEIARQVHVPVAHVHKTIVWGNHGETQVPDMSQATYDDPVSGKTISVNEKLSTEYLQGEFVHHISQRAWEVRDHEGHTSVASAAIAAIDQMHDWVFGTPEGEWASMGIPVPDNEPYGIKKGIIFSFPCTIKDGKCHVVEGLNLNQWVKDKLKITENDLIEERKHAFSVLGLEA